jgi:hypothetical protein
LVDERGDGNTSSSDSDTSDARPQPPRESPPPGRQGSSTHE